MERDKLSKSLQGVLTASDGKLALDIDALSAAAKIFVTGIARQPDLPERLAKMALVFRAMNKNGTPVYWRGQQGLWLLIISPFA